MLPAPNPVTVLPLVPSMTQLLLVAPPNVSFNEPVPPSIVPYAATAIFKRGGLADIGVGDGTTVEPIGVLHTPGALAMALSPLHL